MLKLFRYLKRSAGYVAMIVLLLFLQAYCDLSLPSYTSDIVNVGIQQKGVEDGVPEQISGESLETLGLFMRESDYETVTAAYEENDGVYELIHISSDEREELNEIMCKPELVLSNLTSNEETAAQIKEQMGIPAEMDILDVIAQMPTETRETMFASMTEQIDQMPESIVTQSAIAFVQNEYESLGIDLDDMQMDYLVQTGIRMLGLALLLMLAAVCVTFLSAKVAAAVGHDLRNDVYRKVIGFSNGE